MTIKVIAEAAQGYEGNYQLTEMLLKAAAASKADAIKYQLVYADELCTPDYDYYDLFKSLELRNSEWMQIKKLAYKLNIELQFDIFGSKSLSLCERLNIKTIKLHPTDVSNIGLLDLVSNSKIPNICLGVGGSRFNEILTAIKVLENKKIILMTGFQNYPTPTKSNQISRISYIREKLSQNKNVYFGFADHEVSASLKKYMIPAIAIGAGASFIEKHFTLSKSLQLEDSETALGPEDFKSFSKSIKSAYLSLGKTKNKDDFGMSNEELNYRNTIRRHVIAKSKIKKGSIIRSKDLILKRSPEKNPIKELESAIGLKAIRNININRALNKKDLSKK